MITRFGSVICPRFLKFFSKFFCGLQWSRFEWHGILCTQSCYASTLSLSSLGRAVCKNMTLLYKLSSDNRTISACICDIWGSERHMRGVLVLIRWQFPHAIIDLFAQTRHVLPNWPPFTKLDLLYQAHHCLSGWPLPIRPARLAPGP